MTTPGEMTEHRIAVIVPESGAVLAVRDIGDYRLPRISIPQGVNLTHALRNALRSQWDLPVLILEYVIAQGSMPSCAIAQLLLPATSTAFFEVMPSQLAPGELTEEDLSALLSILEGKALSLFSRMGWLNEVVCWVERATRQSLGSQEDIEQVRAGGGTALVRFRMQGGNDYWLKAAGEENHSELPITKLLSTICEEYLPELVDSRSDWNAWLMAGQALAIERLPQEPLALFNFLEDAIVSMAELQLRTVGRERELLEAGAFDQRSYIFATRSEEIFECIEEVMGLQTSTKVPRIERRRLRELREILERVSELQNDLGIPDTVLHGDLNCANILAGQGHCQFIDWCEAYVGNPLISFEHLLLLHQGSPSIQRETNARRLKDCYKARLAQVCDPRAIERGFLYAPMLAAYSTLHGRGDWPGTPMRRDPRCQASIRSIARYLDRAACDPRLLASIGFNMHA